VNPLRTLAYHGIQAAVVTLDTPRLVVLRGEPAITRGALALPLVTGVCVAVQRPQLPALELEEEGAVAAFAVEVRGSERPSAVASAHSLRCWSALRSRCEMRGVEGLVLKETHSG